MLSPRRPCIRYELDAKITCAFALGAAGGVNYTHSRYGFRVSPLAFFQPAYTMMLSTRMEEQLPSKSVVRNNRVGAL